MWVELEECYMYGISEICRVWQPQPIRLITMSAQIMFLMFMGIGLLFTVEWFLYSRDKRVMKIKRKTILPLIELLEKIFKYFSK